MCPGNGTIQCALGMGLVKCTGNETIQGALGKGLANLPWERELANVP